MASPFDSRTYIDLRRERETLRNRAATEQAQRTHHLLTVDVGGLYCGDHWQNGNGWIGPRPSSADNEYPLIMAEIQRGFVFRNTVREIVERHRDGVVGREPQWRIVEDGENDREPRNLSEVEQTLTTWWDARKMLRLLQAFCVELLLHRRSALRIVVPRAALTEDGYASAPDLASALRKLRVQVVPHNQVEQLTDDETLEEAYAYYYERNGINYIELHYLDLDTNETVVRLLGSDGSNHIARNDLNGALLLNMAEREEFVSSAIVSLQLHLNMVRTMEGRNAIQGGFLERTLLNAQMPGQWVDDPNGQMQPDGSRKTFRPAPLRIGPNRTNFINGLPIYGEDGSITGYTSPSLHYRDPVSPETFLVSEESAYRAILSEAKQLHALISGDATASGESRKQARADFEQSLAHTKAAIDGALRGLLSAAYALASVMSGGSAHGWRVQAETVINSGPLTSDEQTAIVSLVDKKLLSRETGMSQLGIEDVDAEVERIEAEEAAAPASPAPPTTTPPPPTNPGTDPVSPTPSAS